MKRILLAEDDPHIGRLVVFKLQKEGFAVTWVTDGRQALDHARAATFDLILLDVMMPVLDGLQTLSALHGDPALAEIPVAMLTAKGQEADVVASLNAGAVDHILKPFDLTELVRRVREILNGR
jgi:DNA-binding response OmpR family regulator